MMTQATATTAAPAAWRQEEENAWEAAAAAAGIDLLGVDMNDVVDPLYQALHITEYASKTRLRAYIRRLQQQPQQRQVVWYQVTGIIKRNKHVDGVRFKLISLAKRGYYPAGMSVSEAFKVERSEAESEDLLNYVWVIFEERREAVTFITEVDSYVTKTNGISVCEPGFDYSEIHLPPFNRPNLVLESHYVPRKTEGEDNTPDSPPWDVAIDAVSIYSAPSRYSTSDTVYKYQRIEVDQAFARCAPQGAHIFPKAKCKGKLEWLDKQHFNRLAMSLDGHEQFEGTARGRGVSAETSPLVALQPDGSDIIRKDGEDVTRIAIKLWCRDSAVAKAWRSALKADVSLHEAEGHCYYTPNCIFYRANLTYRIEFEEQQEADGRTHLLCVTAIPGVEDPSTLSSWNQANQTVAVSEIVESLLKWSYEDVRRIWRTIP